MAGNRKVFQNSILYSVSSLMTKAIGFLMLPIYTRLVAAEGYGSITLVTSFVAVASYVAALSLYSAILRFYSEYQEDPERLKRFLGTIFTFLPLAGGGFVALALLLKDPLTRLVFRGLSFYPLVLIAICLVFFSMLHTAHTTVLQAMQQGRRLSLVNVTVCLVQVCLTLVLLKVFSLGAAGVLLSQLTVYTLYALYAYWDLARRGLIRFGISLPLLRQSLSYSVPMLPHNLSGNIADLASKLFLNRAATLSGVGVYGVASQFGMVIDTIQSAGNQAFMPWYFEELKSGPQRDRAAMALVTKTLLILYSLLYMAIGLFSQEAIILFLGAGYHEAWRVIPLIVAAFSVKSIYYFLVNVLMYRPESARRIFLATVTGSLSEILLLSFFVPLLGMYGSALSLLLAKVVTVAIAYAMARKYDELPLPLLEQMQAVLPSLGFLALGLAPSYLYFGTGLHLANFLWKCLVLGLYLVYLWKTVPDLPHQLRGLLGRLRAGKHRN